MKKTLAGYSFCWLAIEGERNLFGQNQFALGGNSQTILGVVMNNRPFSTTQREQGFRVQRCCGCRLSLACGHGAGFQRCLGVHGGSGYVELPVFDVSKCNGCSY